jgi:hypothetical protein
MEIKFCFHTVNIYCSNFYYVTCKITNLPVATWADKVQSVLKSIGSVVLH